MARGVEHLFGPMADEAPFRDGLRQAIANRTALCIRFEGDTRRLRGGIIIAPEANEIVWFAVASGERGRGCGALLLSRALEHLDRTQEVYVQTFDDSVPEGAAARRLYGRFGFVDYKRAHVNSAGVTTVIMRLSAS